MLWKRRLAGVLQNVTSNSNLQRSNAYDNRTTSGTELRLPQNQLRRYGKELRRQNTISLREFVLNHGVCEIEEQRRRRTVSVPSPTQNWNILPAKVSFDGNRRVPSLHWMSGLREPQQTSATEQNKSISLFVDSIPQGLATSWLRRRFERCGKVIDVFISAKTRKNNKNLFGFVRYGSTKEANTAIEELNGLAIQGRHLWISMARYSKGGAPVQNNTPPTRKEWKKPSKIFHPAHRDHRRYSEVVLGNKNRKDNAQSGVEKDNKTIPIAVCINIAENMQMAAMLNLAVIAENTDAFDIENIKAELHACDTKETGIFFLSPTKLLIVFDSKNEANNAVSMDSPLWNVFDDIRIWSEGESFDDRLVWIECIGIHSLCWSNENLRLIGENWGLVIHIDANLQGVDKITSARLLVRTKAQNRIDNRVKLFYEHGSCDVWVKEYYGKVEQSPVHGCEDRINGPNGDLVNMKKDTLHCPQTNSHPFFDPLMQDMCMRKEYKEYQEWIDPIVMNENILWNNVLSADLCYVSENQSSPPIPPITHNIIGNSSSKPRGRPKKNRDHRTPCIDGMNEAEKTWETAQLLCISTDDEQAVLSGLRKSKRVLIMEGKGD